MLKMNLRVSNRAYENLCKMEIYAFCHSKWYIYVFSPILITCHLISSSNNNQENCANFIMPEQIFRFFLISFCHLISNITTIKPQKKCEIDTLYT